MTKDPNLFNIAELDAEIDLLAAVEPGDAPFLSCYLDMRQGKEACKHFLETTAAGMRSALSATARFDFDDALNLIDEQLDRHWNPHVRGLALFSRGLAGGRYMGVLRFAAPVVNALTLYPVPDIVPLLTLRQREAGFVLLLQRGSTLQVCDVEMGSAATVAWTSGLSTGNSRRSFAAPSRLRLTGGTRTVRRALARRSGAPLVVAGDDDRLDDILGLLPGRMRARVAEQFVLPAGLSEKAAIERVRTHMTAARGRESAELATHLVRVSRPHGNAVFGQVATQQALREGNAETLVIAEERIDAGEWRWDARLELSRLARQQDIPIVASSSDELRYLGGVGCTLRRRSKGRPISLPARGIELVA